MPFRRGRRPVARGRAPRKRAVWINIPFAAVTFTETVGNQVLLVPEDWEASFTGLAIESATLRAIVGEICFKQTVVGTNGGVFFWGLYLRGQTDTAVPTFTTSGMSENIWLRTGARSTASVITDSLTANNNYWSTQEIDIKVKRKLTSASEICICAQFGADAASPSAVIGGLLRFLVARD